MVSVGLADHDNYHAFCRLLGRFKVNYQLSELVNADGYTDWIRLVADFTLKSLHSWQWAGSSVYYLLGMWSRLVTSVRFLKTDTANLLDEYAPKIIEGFISSRFDSLQSEFSDELSEDPLDNVELLQDQLDFIPYLCRFQYETCGMYIMKIMEPILQLYMDGANLQCSQFVSILLLNFEVKFIFFHIKAADSFLNISGCLFNLFVIYHVYLFLGHWQRYGELSKQRLDCAILTFLQQFRKSFVGDYALHSSKQLYARLSELLGIHDHLLLLVAIVRKIVTNLKSYSQSKVVIDHTLSVFLEMTSGSMLGKLLLKLDIIKYIISNHDKEHFPFLDEYRCSRSRTTFYFAIAALIFMEDSLLKFKSSMDPLLQVFVSLESTTDATFHSDAVKYALIGLMRDLRGIAMATKSHRTYCFLFDWLYPARLPLLLKAIAYWTDTPECASAVDKLATFYFIDIVTGESPSSPAALCLAQHVTNCPGLFQEILSTLFEIIIFGDGGNQRNLSRPMLSLILINEETLTNIKGQILASHPPDQQQHLSLCFEKLMADITRSLDLNNRDKFTQNLIRFKNEFRSKRYAAILT
ncbi:hypothetical protein SO802_031959 [Lithocarpus litseifolius]|uniref:Exportin-7/Ran-binding protein 17 TPR repeats domain-containing protein n=1 Tax=Lithocarpus litseifolius TaxID=425828 RepID=A0AAW2BMZ2_9ROSI